jgi:hypothetical protein
MRAKRAWEDKMPNQKANQNRFSAHPSKCSLPGLYKSITKVLKILYMCSGN